MTISRHVRTASIALVGLLAAAPIAAQDIGQREVGAAFRSTDEAAIPPPLQAVYDRLADSWRDEDARAIAELARDGRVQVVVQREGISQRLAASQLQYVLDEIFETSVELGFRYPGRPIYDPELGVGYAVGERRYQEGARVEPRVDRIFVGARNEHGRWVLSELRLLAD